jgi:hypothetical protein
MRVILFFLAALAFMASLAVTAIAKSAVHEILAAIYMLISAVLFCGAAVVDSVINSAAKAHKDRAEAFQTLSNWLDKRLPRDGGDYDARKLRGDAHVCKHSDLVCLGVF